MRAFLYRIATDQSQGLSAFILKCVFSCLEPVYGILVRFAAAAARKTRLPLRVVSVGNVTVGGTGKTPLVEAVVRILQAHGCRPAVVTRGYALRQGVSADEPELLRKSLPGIPVIVNPDRAAGARVALKEFGADTVVLDDGFQQWGIVKDVDIVAVDATRPFGNGRLLPRGILREPLSALKRADVFAITKANLCADTAALRQQLAGINPRAAVIEAHHVITGFCGLTGNDEGLPVSALRGAKTVAFSGIGDPDSFERMLGGLGVDLAAAIRFTDHHEFTPGDLRRIADDVARTGSTAAITTAKDAVRLRSLELSVIGCPVMYARLETVIVRGEEELRARLRQLCTL